MTSAKSEPDDEALDGLEWLRVNIYQMSKAFYGPGGPARRLPVVEVSTHSRKVRRRDWRADIARRTSIREPAPVE